MSASDWDIWRHTTNVIQRDSYGVNGKKHFKLQKERAQNMAEGGNGGVPNNHIMSDTSGHDSSIRAMHFADWDDSDFGRVLEGIAHWEATGELPKEPPKEAVDPVTMIVERAVELFSSHDRDTQIEALNSLAEALGVMEPEEDTE